MFPYVLNLTLNMNEKVLARRSNFKLNGIILKTNRKRDCFGDDLGIIGAYDILVKPDVSFSLCTQIIELSEAN